MHGARRRGDYGGGGARQKSGTPGGVRSPGPSKPTTFEELNRLLQSRNRSLSTRINSVLQVLEENRDNLRGFFAACYQTLLWQIFNSTTARTAGCSRRPPGTSATRGCCSTFYPQTDSS